VPVVNRPPGLAWWRHEPLDRCASYRSGKPFGANQHVVTPRKVDRQGGCAPRGGAGGAARV